MLVRYWNPWREMETLRNQFDQIMGDLTHPIANSADVTTWTPAVELQDTGDNLVLRAQLPGMEAKDLDIKVTREAVAITAERRHEQKSEEKGFFRSEFRYGKFRRVVPLPVAIQNDRVQAEYKDGILNLTLPKVVEVRNQVVKVNLTEAQAPAVTEPASEPATEQSSEAAAA
ncbi:MAG: Hsp20/alpha crystallin family protein [Oculatellaceae cyanobacterium Prado106]|jgi:HSP20 family protein|nr:Hsp20/alpha crystallin family protein [Oculatellaceae cyanobacterium Prado106]